MRRSPAAAAFADNPEFILQALDKLVDDEIAAQKAISDSADKQDKFIYASDSARREILAQLAFEKLANTVGKPSADEVRTFYNDTYPQMFKDRRVYVTDEVVVGAPGLQALKADLQGSTFTIDTALKRLDSAGAEYRRELVITRPEDLPFPLLPKLSAWSNRMPLVIQAPGALRLLFLRSSEPMPIRFDDARPRIERFLMTQRWNDTRQRLTQEWRNDTKIVLAPRYEEMRAKVKEAAAATAGSPAPAEMPAAATDRPATSAQTAPATPADAGATKAIDSAIRKGIDGLK